MIVSDVQQAAGCLAVDELLTDLDAPLARP